MGLLQMQVPFLSGCHFLIITKASSLELARVSVSLLGYEHGNSSDHLVQYIRDLKVGAGPPPHKCPIKSGERLWGSPPSDLKDRSPPTCGSTPPMYSSVIL